MPPAHLLRLHRHSLACVLVQGGTDRQGAETSFAFHDASPLRSGPFLILDCARDESRLSHALQTGLISENDLTSVDPLREGYGCTLFLGGVSSLYCSTQRLLLMLARR